MASVTLPARLETPANLRALNAVRDLPQVADLIETCFAAHMDGDGRRYVRELRRATQGGALLGLARRVGESVSLPLTGYVWEDAGKVVGNASLIPFRDRERRIYLIANVAVRPNYRRRGIASTLTARAMEHAWEHGAEAVWLSVREDSAGALDLYRKLGFVERARRTTWLAPEALPAPGPSGNSEVVARDSRNWELQRAWLAEAYPNDLAWHRRWDFSALRPGFLRWISTWLLDFGIQQWQVNRDGKVQAVLAYLPGSAETVLFPAIGSGSDPDALTQLLLHARQRVPVRPRLSLEFPVARFDEAIAAAGFEVQRTLVWMRARAATQGPRYT